MKRILLTLLTLFCVLLSVVSCGEQDGLSDQHKSLDNNSSLIISESDISDIEENSRNDFGDASDISYDSSDDSDNVSEESFDHEIDNSEVDNNDDNDNSEVDEGEIEVLFDSSFMENYSSPALPSYAPFCLYDTTLFSGTVITSISFPFSGLASGYTVSSENLYMPIYIIKSDFSSKKSDCTIENGKKINLDFTGKLYGVSAGDWITVDNLNITVGTDETIAFCDTDMPVIPMFLRDNGTFGFWNRVFDSKGGNNHSLIFRIEGFPNKKDTMLDSPDGTTYISFLGDSISTFKGYSDNIEFNTSIGGNAVWYPNSDYSGGNMRVEDTWWYNVCSTLDFELCVNNSWSGSVVMNSQTYNVRSRNLHNTSNNIKPDIVVIFMGANDFAAGTPVGSFDGSGGAPMNPKTFSEAYGRLVSNILKQYNDVEIYCCTFLPDRKRFSSGMNGSNIPEEDYNDAIRKIAGNMNVNLIDLFNHCGINESNISKYTVDKLHPNAAGMELISELICSVIEE